MKKPAVKKRLNNIYNVQECDANKAQQRNEADNKNFIIIKI